MAEFVHLHVHTEYSLLDGAARIRPLIEAARDAGMHALAITDHGTMYGAVDFYLAAKEAGIRPIIGCEVYTAPRTRFDKTHAHDANYGHLVLLAYNNVGYRNLMALSSLGFVDGYYYKPRVDKELLEKYHEGLICLSACLKGEIPQAILSGNYGKAKRIAQWYASVFGRENFYLEVQNHGIAEEEEVGEALKQLSAETGIGLVATNDVHYIRREDALMQDVLTCIQTGKKLHDKDRMQFGGDAFYLRSPAEMEHLFADFPGAMENTIKIADRCHVELDFHHVYLPEFESGMPMDNYAYLHSLCQEGIVRKYGGMTEQLKNRLEKELTTIQTMGYTDYFLIVWDFIKYAKENGILVGPGRGSAAGSLVSYALDITTVDPIRYQLLFERFLNPERVSMPDIDIDFCYLRRDEVKNYVTEKYGADRVAHIATFGTMAARAAVRDVGRVLDLPYPEVDRVAKAIPSALHITLPEAIRQNAELKQMYDTRPQVKQLLDLAMALEGFPRHVSTHAAGVVISAGPLFGYVPVQTTETGLLTQYPMNILEKLGLLKMDFLGLRNLTVIQDAMDTIRQTKGISLNTDTIPYDDPDTYALISRGDTEGLFQLESPGMKRFLKQLKPENLEDVIAAISLYRPGPMEQIPRYLENRRNPDGITYADPRLEPILSPTYGCMVYQEQVMQVVQTVAGYSLGRADLVRRMMAKKKKADMEREREVFLHGMAQDGENAAIPGAVACGMDEQTACALWEELADFANYAFNKSHAAAYAVVAYQTAYLKCHYPTEFLAALLKSLLGNSPKVAQYIEDFSKYGIRLLPPDVNQSEGAFTAEGKDVRFGLSALKNVGMTFPASISKERERKGKFTGFGDFVERMSGSEMNKRTMEVMIKCGVFDSLYPNRKVLLLNSERMIDNHAPDAKKRAAGQVSFFGEVPEERTDTFEHRNEADFDARVKLGFEKEFAGMYLTGHPLDALRLKVKAFSDADILSVLEGEHKEGKSIRLCGVITGRSDKRTKAGATMALVTLEDFYNAIEVVVFPAMLAKYGTLLTEGRAVCVDATVNEQEDRMVNIALRGAYDLAALNVSADKKLYIRLHDRAEFEEATTITAKYPGTSPLYLYAEWSGQTVCADDKHRVLLCNDLIGRLCAKFGDENIKIR